MSPSCHVGFGQVLGSRSFQSLGAWVPHLAMEWLRGFGFSDFRFHALGVFWVHDPGFLLIPIHTPLSRVNAQYQVGW